MQRVSNSRGKEDIVFSLGLNGWIVNLLLMAPGTFFVPSFGLPMPVGRNSKNRTSPIQAASKDQTNEQVSYRVPSLGFWNLDPTRSRNMPWNTDILPSRPMPLPTTPVPKPSRFRSMPWNTDPYPAHTGDILSADDIFELCTNLVPQIKTQFISLYVIIFIMC